MKLLEIKNLKKNFENLKVLKDISLSVDENEVVSIIGPSGSGKSTFLRCMTMLETIDSGEIIYCEETAVKCKDGISFYADKKDLKRIKGYFGFVFQNFNLFPHYTVLKNITDAPINVQKRNKEVVIKEAEELIKKLGLDNKGDFYPHQLSGGQQQRVAIARALAMKPKIIFFDEPTSALDPELTAELLKVFRTLASEKMTMIIVTHEIDFAKNVSDRVVFMDNGYIVEQGLPSDVIDNPANERTKSFLEKI